MESPEWSHPHPRLSVYVTRSGYVLWPLNSGSDVVGVSKRSSWWLYKRSRLEDIVTAINTYPCQNNLFFFLFRTYGQRVGYGRQERHDGALDVVEIGDRRHRGHRPDLLLVLRSLRAQHEEYGRAHGVSHVVQVRFVRRFQNVIDRVRQVDRAHLVPAIHAFVHLCKYTL